MSNDGNNRPDNGEEQLGFDSEFLDSGETGDSEPEVTSLTEEDDYEGEDEYTPHYTHDAVDYDADPDSLLEEDGEYDEDIEYEEEFDDDEPGESIDDPVPDSDHSWAEEKLASDLPTRPTWPLPLIAVGAIALLLIIAGGYGVMQQRSSMEQEVQQLRAKLATAIKPEDAAADRQAKRTLEERNTELEADIMTLRLENRQLSDTVTGLETQLTVQQEVTESGANKTTVAPTPQPQISTPAKKPEPKAPPPAPAADTDGKWWVNFGSYGKEAIAQDWATRLKPASGEVVVIPTLKDGSTLYRVRVISIDSRESAESIAESLASKYDIPKLWVGAR